MPDCLSGKGIGWLGDPGRKGVALPVGIYTPPPKKKLVQSSAAFLKKYALLPSFFYSQFHYWEKIRRN